MLTKRIIPCLDVIKGRVTKGVKFKNNIDLGDPIEMAIRYSEGGADELVFYDITASAEGRQIDIEMVRRAAERVFVPFTVGGGISSVDDVARLLGAGADKISINSSALHHPELISHISKAYGNQVCVVAIDARMEDDGQWMCYVKGGRQKTNRRLVEWAHEAQERGAGEILFTSMNHDGVKQGFAIDALRQLHQALSIPVIASGGCGTMAHFKDAFTLGQCDAALAASVFHFGEISIRDLKQYLLQENINVRTI